MSKKLPQDIDRESLLLALEQLSETLALMQRVTHELQAKLVQGIDPELIKLMDDWQTDHHPALQQALHDLPGSDEDNDEWDNPLRCNTPIVIH